MRLLFTTALRVLALILMLMPINAAADTESVAVGDSTATITPDNSLAAADTIVDKRNRLQRWRDGIKERINKKINEPYDTVRDGRYWWRAMKHGKVDFKDSTIHYPKFVRFCYNAYVWGDRAFNSYDTAYVVSTGKNWKLQLKNQNWIDDYLGGYDKDRVHFTSGASSNIGLYLSFMAVSVGYSLDIDRLFGGKATSEKLEFSFTCARFTAEVHKITNHGSMRSRVKMDGGDWHKSDKLAVDAVRRETKGLSASYFFNNKKYARAAAYCYSKFQKRSAGSALAGLAIDNYDFKVDMERLTPEQAEGLVEAGVPHVRYTDYCLSGGYAYNWVMSRKFLLNVTGIVGGGVKHIHSTGGRPSDNSGALKLTGSFALTFNHKRYFASIIGNANTSMYISGKEHFGYSIYDFTAVLGIRF